MEDYNIPVELEEELETLRKRDQIYTWILVALLVALAFIGVRMYMQARQQNVNTATYSSQNGVPLANVTNLPTGANQFAGGSAGGGCCGGGSGAKVPQAELEKQALDAYKAQFGDQAGIKAKVTDYGCHQQIDIMDKDNNLLKSYQFRGGQLSLIGQ